MFRTFPLNNQNYDASYLQNWLGTRIHGVYSADENLRVKERAAPAMSVTITKGVAWLSAGEFKGVVFVNDGDIHLGIDVADGVQNRIDAIVVRLDKMLNTGVIALKKGEPGTTATPPELQRDTAAFEIMLAHIVVSAGTVQITNEEIRDTRLDDELCGIMRDGVTGIPSQALSDLFYEKLDTMEAATIEMLSGLGIVQKRGTSTELVMSQNAVCEEIDVTEERLNVKLDGSAEELQNQISQRVAIVNKASSADVAAGTDNNKWVTPSALAPTLSPLKSHDGKIEDVFSKGNYYNAYTTAPQKIMYKSAGDNFTLDSSCSLSPDKLTVAKFNNTSKMLAFYRASDLTYVGGIALPGGRGVKLYNNIAVICNYYKPLIVTHNSGSNPQLKAIIGFSESTSNETYCPPVQKGFYESYNPPKYAYVAQQDNSSIRVYRVDVAAGTAIAIRSYPPRANSSTGFTTLCPVHDGVIVGFHSMAYGGHNYVGQLYQAVLEYIKDNGQIINFYTGIGDVQMYGLTSRGLSSAIYIPSEQVIYTLNFTQQLEGSSPIGVNYFYRYNLTGQSSYIGLTTAEPFRGHGVSDLVHSTDTGMLYTGNYKFSFSGNQSNSWANYLANLRFQSNQFITDIITGFPMGFPITMAKINIEENGGVFKENNLYMGGFMK